MHTTNNLSFVDAQEMARLYPDTFEAPTTEELDAVIVGDNVRVCCANLERFWVIVKSIDGSRMTGTVNNNLVFTGDHGLLYGDEIAFEKRHIYSVFTHEMAARFM